MLVLIGSYLLLVFILPVALSAVVTYRALPRGSSCADCGGHTVRVVGEGWRGLRLARRLSLVQRRWCMACGWEGRVRGGRNAGSTADVAPAPPPAPAATHTLDVRSLSVDGSPWRVMLQCWNATGSFYGRFVFIGPSGRLWLDSVEAFNGTSQHEVLGQVQALPEGLLTYRLRRLVGEC